MQKLLTTDSSKKFAISKSLRIIIYSQLLPSLRRLDQNAEQECKSYLCLFRDRPYIGFLHD